MHSPRTLLYAMNITKITIILLVCSIGLTSLAQDDMGFNLVQPSTLILGTKYEVEIPKSDDVTQYFLVLNNDTLKSDNGVISFRPQNGSSKLYCIQLLSFRDNQYKLLEKKCYDRIRMPAPYPSFGAFSGSSLIWLPKDSINKLDQVELVFDTRTEQVLDVTDLQVFARVKDVDKTFKFDGARVTEEFKSFLLSKYGTWDVTLYVSFKGSDQYTRTTEGEFEITIQTEENYARHLNPFYDLHHNKHVEFIGPGSFSKDTLRMNNPGDLYVQCLKLGTENNYTFESLDNEEKFEVQVMNQGTDGFLDMRNKHGIYRVTLWGDGGAGSLILVIE